MKKRDLQKKIDTTLFPGDLYIAWEPKLIKTILGSCVSLVFWSPTRRVAAISHAQLPTLLNQAYACLDSCLVPCLAHANQKESFRYVSCSTEYILARFNAAGIKTSTLEVKLFGGANVLSQPCAAKTVGDRNIEVAHQVIKKHGLKLVGEDTGGHRGRVLFLSSATGEVWIFKNRDTSVS